MRFKRSCLLLCLFTTLAMGQNQSPKLVNKPSQPNQSESQEQFELKRQSFTSGRQLLLEKGVPFDPDELLHDGWTKKLKATLDRIPEMHESRYEKAPLHGAYLGDTIYLPENVELSGHTVILANYVVFEGKNPIIKGNYDIHFFPARPVAVLGTNLAEALHKKAGLLNVKFRGKPALPSFALIQDVASGGKHEIIIDVSGRPPQAEQHPSRTPAKKLHDTSWTLLNSALQTTISCTSSCGNDGATGATGTPGFSPPPADTGNPNGGPPAANGSCGPLSNPSGSHGGAGGLGAPGTNAGNGGQGGPGFYAGTINATIQDGDTNSYTFSAHGGQGGQGGAGGTGGQGGSGGAGIAGGNGVACSCTSIGNGGNGGLGGAAGAGGRGGDGGPGGNGGNGGVINASIPFDGTTPSTSVAGGPPGRGGDPGPSGSPGVPGPGGQPGAGASTCGLTSSNGTFLGGGSAAGSNGPGNPGPFGTSSGANGTANITPRPDPNAGGGGGGGGDGTPCDGGSGFFNVGNEGGCGSPVIIDAEAEGFHMTSALAGVSFDIRGTGNPVEIAWTDQRFHNAFLTLPGPDGLVHNGKELFGNFTPQPQSAHPNGFLALAQYDKPENGGNADGIIDDKDTVFSQLRLWIDENHDGVCQPEELHRLPEFGVYSLALNFVESRRKDEFGNLFRYRAQINPGERKDIRDQTPSGNPGRWAYDVFFVIK